MTYTESKKHPVSDMQATKILRYYLRSFYSAIISCCFFDKKKSIRVVNVLSLVNSCKLIIVENDKKKYLVGIGKSGVGAILETKSVVSHPPLPLISETGSFFE